jgi:hypothetical protein
MLGLTRAPLVFVGQRSSESSEKKEEESADAELFSLNVSLRQKKKKPSTNQQALCSNAQTLKEAKPDSSGEGDAIEVGIGKTVKPTTHSAHKSDQDHIASISESVVKSPTPVGQGMQQPAVAETDEKQDIGGRLCDRLWRHL